jgi:hypothetical protein
MGYTRTSYRLCTYSCIVRDIKQTEDGRRGRRERLGDGERMKAKGNKKRSKIQRGWGRWKRKAHAEKAK